MYSGYCNTKQLILPDPTINLQRVVDNGYKLQGANPTTNGQVVGYNGSNVVWLDSASNIPTLQQVLDKGHTATDVPIQLDGPNTNDAFVVMEHDKIKLDNNSNYTNEITALEQRIMLTVSGSPYQTNVSTCQSQTISQGSNTNYLSASEQTIQNAAGNLNTSTALQNKLELGNDKNISTATTILISDGLNNTNTINVSSNTIYTPSGSNTSTATAQTLTISGYSNTITAQNQTFTSGGNTNTATSTDVTIVNGSNSVAMDASGIKINNQYICPEYIHYVKNNTIIDDYSDQLPCKITYINNGLTTPFVLSPNTTPFPSSISTTAIYNFNGTFVIGTDTGECYRWDSGSFLQFADFDGPITSFATTNNNYLLIGGQFTQLQGYGFNCYNISICDSGFNFYQLPDGFNARVNCLKQCASYTNLIFVGGNFNQTYNGATMPYFSILDFNSGSTNPAFKVLGNFGAGATGGFNDIVNTISNTSDYVFIGGNFTYATDGVTQYYYPNGTVWQTDYQGFSVNVSPFYEINSGAGISGPVICSDYNSNTSKFCIGISGSFTSFNFSTDGTSYASGLTANNPITTIYEYLSNLYFADGVNVYINGNVIGTSSTSGVQAISYVPHLSTVGFGINTSGTTGFNYLTPTNQIDCTLPTGTFYFLGQLNTATKIILNNKGSWFYLLWDGTNYQLLNGQYYDIALI